MVIKAIYSKEFKKDFSKIKDKSFKKKIKKQIEKIIHKPEIGKPMKYGRIGSREVYVPPFRLSYTYNKNNGEMVLLSIIKINNRRNSNLFL